MPRGGESCKLYIGELGNNGNEREIEDAFAYYGPLKMVWVARRPPGFAFVEYEDPRDAEDAARAMDNRMLCGRRIRVQVSHGRSRWPEGRPPEYLLRRPAPRYVNEDQRCSECGRRGHRARECFRRLREDGGGSSGRRRSKSRSRSPRNRDSGKDRKARRDRSRSGSNRSSRSRSRSPRGNKGRTNGVDRNKSTSASPMK